VTVTEARGLLLLLRAKPTLLPPAPLGLDPRAMDRRAYDEVHPCLGCGSLAHLAYVADCQLYGFRWLDLCYDCAASVREANN